jgi:hypothetical protein
MADLTTEEFDHWHKPQEVFAMLPPGLDWSTIALSIGRRMLDGLIQTAAETIVSKGEPRGPVKLDPSVWRDLVHTGPGIQRFWQTGEYEVSVPTVYNNTARARVYGVRLDPEGVRKLIGSLTTRPVASAPVLTAPIEAPPPAADDRKPLPSAEQRRFCELLVGVYGHEAATESLARRALTAMYPDRSVSRDGFRDLLREVRELKGAIPLGRPSGGGK